VVFQKEGEEESGQGNEKGVPAGQACRKDVLTEREVLNLAAVHLTILTDKP